MKFTKKLHVYHGEQSPRFAIFKSQEGWSMKIHIDHFYWIYVTIPNFTTLKWLFSMVKTIYHKDVLFNIGCSGGVEAFMECNEEDKLWSEEEREKIKSLLG